MKDCRAEAIEIVLGDARLRLREAPDHAFGLIVLDAFSSDSLPVHLLSREAIELYRSKLAASGVLAFNLSNRYLDLEPVLGRQAVDAGLVCRIAYDVAVTPEEKQAGKQPSIWAVMAEAESDLDELADDPRWRMPRLRPGSAVWTDDFSDLASYIRWLPPRIETRTRISGFPISPFETEPNDGRRSAPSSSSRRRVSEVRWDLMHWLG